MQKDSAPAIIDWAIGVAAEMSPQETDGKWLEELTADVGRHIKEWDIVECYRWADWPERETRFPSAAGRQDVGIDAVGIRRSDGAHVAIQCKARQLDDNGRGADIHKVELDKFIAASVNSFWAERWLVTNGDNRVSSQAAQVIAMSDPERPVKLVNIHADLIAQQDAAPPERCPHCDADAPPDARQTKQCMQDEAVRESVRILKEHAASESGGRPAGQARGKIILPCGTGKTRISLRIVEELTQPGELAIVLCPSIALVAQIRREYLQHAAGGLRALAVCSDATAGYDPKKEDTRNTAADPTLDNSNVSAAEVKGQVTTDAAAIAEWMRQGEGNGRVNVIFGTYQSSHRISEALLNAKAEAAVLIADEAHRTAGLRRSRKRDAAIRDFTVCHDHARFPATYRVYQTATPRIYDAGRVNRDQPGDWLVRSMDDETVFGVELYRKSYMEAVRNGWLADYRIIALGVNDPEAYRQANLLASNTKSKGRRALTTTDYLRGLAFTLAMGGATQDDAVGNLPIASCIAFMNTVDKSRNMAQDLQTAAVRKWLQDWLQRNPAGASAAAPYTLEHLDATSNATARDNAKRRLGAARAGHPHSVINVGIFGEGTDAPSLNAVAFLEARKSPIDVIQAVGRAMRTAPGKAMGYIICPILIPPNADPERWLSASAPEEGWQELGQILLALRAHDQRIEDNLAELLQLYLPRPPEVERTIVAIATGEDRRISYREHEGPPGTAQQAVARVLAGESTLAAEFRPITETDAGAPASGDTPDAAAPADADTLASGAPASGDTPVSGAPADADTPASGAPADADAWRYGEAESGAARGIAEPLPPMPPAPMPAPEPTQIIAGKKNRDGSSELRLDTVARTKPKADGAPGKVDIAKSKAKARDMINKGAGVRITPRLTRAERTERQVQSVLQLDGMTEYGNAIKMNLLAKSGLTGNRVIRDLNILEAGIREAAHHLRNDGLQSALDAHFGLDNMQAARGKGQADGGTIAALLMMNAAMLHQRIANGKWMSGVRDLDAVKNSVNVVREMQRQWNAITRHDFKPVLEPAVKAIEAVEDTGKLAGLERALRHIAAEAERIAETYADMGADHAGPLFNRVMGNQASDGAFFTRPVAAAIAARLTLDAGGDDGDWTSEDVWREFKTVDLACGSGTLLAAMLTEMKRRAREQGAGAAELAALQKLAVEDTIKGMDINPVSLQLAASQLTAGNQDIRYRRMGLHLMPYGPQAEDPAGVGVSAGTLELLGQRAIVRRDGELGLADERVASQTVWNQNDDVRLEDAVAAAQDARIVIMNPPFSNRSKMGEKFPAAIQQTLRRRVDDMERLLVRSDPELTGFVDKNSIRPLFTALADKCLSNAGGILAMVCPTIALTAPSGQNERRILAQRYHIHTVLTCHQAGNMNLSQNTSINESVIVAKRHSGAGPKPPTRFINLDRLPADDDEVADWHRHLADCDGDISNGWGTVAYWPVERISAGDWTPAVWRSLELAEAAAQFANDATLPTIESAGLSPAATGKQSGSFETAPAGTPGSFPILKSKSADAQTTIQSQPDDYWIPRNRDDSIRLANGGTYPEADRILQNAGHLLLTAGQDTGTGRLTATADDETYVGFGWTPVTGLSAMEAKALAVFINSTPGRLQLMLTPGRKLNFPQYNPAGQSKIRIPDVRNDGRVCQILEDCWERTKDRAVPQFRDGECEVRCWWDEAVAEALGWDAGELGRLRRLLHQEPHVRGLGYNQYADEGG